MYRSARHALAALIAVLSVGSGVARAETAAHPAAGKRMTAVRAAAAPTVDGVLDDAVWQRAEFISDFHQRDPNEGAPPSRRTDVAFAYDGEALYVAARMHAAGPGDVQAVMTRRDDSGTAERIIVSLDPFMDRRTAYSFAVTAAGVRVDWYHPDDDAFSRDSSYNPVWEAQTVIGDKAWVAEMRIPFSQLRFPDREAHTWGVNLNRYMPQDDEDVFWVVVPKDKTGWSSYFGELQGIERIESSRRIEITPYVAADTTITSGALVDADDPFSDELSAGARAGVDLKMGLGPSLTLDATINPDFGQVEADPAVVNLSAFETSFAERRPFFVEGSQLLSGLGPTYFYSRRIGGPPRGAATTDFDFIDAPQSTSILGAAKVTGRLHSGLSVGALTAVTAAAEAETFDLASGMTDTVPLDPLTGYGVFRLQQEFGQTGSMTGASFATVHRNLDASSPLATQMSRRAYAGGIDGRWRFGRGGAYQIGGYLGGTYLTGEAEAIADIQQRSAHYFQRPDQDHVELDPDATSMAGLGAFVHANKRNGTWRWSASTGFDSPGLEFNDTGLLSSADDIEASVYLEYRQERPTGPLYRHNVFMHLSDEWNFGGARKPGASGVHGSITFHNLWSANTYVDYFFPGQDDDLTRGGPLAGIGHGYRTGVGFSNGHGSRTRLSGSANAFTHDTGNSGFDASFDVSGIPYDWLKLSASPRYAKFEGNRQYIDTLAGGRPETFDLRYVFATVERAEVAVSLRAQAALTPDLSVEVYAEPFASSAEFTSFGELEAPRSRELRDYDIAARDGDTVTLSDGAAMFTIDEPDFTVLSLRSTVVLRWEFRPGSTLFAVWQQNRSDVVVAGDPANPAALGDAVGAPGANTLALKLTYWWPAD